jgi:hypothetical protein
MIAWRTPGRLSVEPEQIAQLALKNILAAIGREL